MPLLKALLTRGSFCSIFLLLFCIIFTYRAAAEAPSFQTEDELRQQTTAKKPPLVGQTLWFVPNAKATIRVGFLKSANYGEKKLYPSSVLKFQIEERLPATPFGIFYRLTFEDGSTGYVDTLSVDIQLSSYTTDSINKNNIVLARRDLDNCKDSGLCIEMFFKEDPAKLNAKITSIDKAIAQHHKQVAKTEAEKQARGGVRVGMTKEQVLASSWGKPFQVNTTVTSGITSEQWVYSGMNYLYFNNGLLSAIQKSD